MTPTEQDSNGDGILKQRIYEEIAVIFAGKDLSHEQIAALMDDRKESVELIMRLITADRKRVALEARIDERQMLSFHRAYGRDYQATLETLEEANDERTAELKEQYESIK